MSEQNTPIFPLRTVLFPASRIPLRIFEPRYLDMVSSCLRSNTEFGVVLSKEVIQPGMYETYNIGTLASIIDWSQDKDGLLNITVIGSNKFELISLSKKEDGLNIADINILEQEKDFKAPPHFDNMIRLLEAILEDIDLFDDLDKQFESASWVSFRFAEILPLKIEDKQKCLELNDPLLRLNYLEPLLKLIRENSQQ
ncbi:MAG TPA: LON peptidase substrate-binding domain-containing protein [Gammaproteobacteria bacterium]|nr:LON peptidase substrate-binding domain-containing protein [Gammaproteobacteria bacterium]HJP42494.1 LON peptidase substrate-binding domain-containing protein [Gammaproteobacteria bacterium]